MAQGSGSDEMNSSRGLSSSTIWKAPWPMRYIRSLSISQNEERGKSLTKLAYRMEIVPVKYPRNGVLVIPAENCAADTVLDRVHLTSYRFTKFERSPPRHGSSDC